MYGHFIISPPQKKKEKKKEKKKKKRIKSKIQKKLKITHSNSNYDLEICIRNQTSNVYTCIIFLSLKCLEKW
jgi:hypothetical protein